MAKELAGENTVVVAIVHDLNLALQYADYLVALKDGEMIAEGLPDYALTEQLMLELYGVKARIVQLEDVDYPIVTI
ncbi:ABC transporter ATP-binding protein [Solitalea lacus]|uniref:ABC transporter ATP-binding protein n=1 Tax=Solitalea lacus TaxID=2911172 RepID=UPI001ED9C6EA|nr:ABC transporter ATP-binding protein [Solitalea lacus]